jgi:hypothetical protein
MAKRAVRRERRRSPAEGHDRAPTPSATPASSTPVWRTSAFWIGGVAVGLLVALVAAAVVIATGDDDQAADPAAAALESQVQSPEGLEKQFAERDRQQIESMTLQARRIADGLAPVMGAFNRALREGGSPPPVSAQWLDTARGYAAGFQESVSGETSTNVARLGLRASLEGLVNAMEIYRLSGDGPNRAAIVARALEQRDIAVRTWSTATIQIDAINIDAGFGHQHVPQLAGAASGAMPPDTLPEGTDARGDG